MEEPALSKTLEESKGEVIEVSDNEILKAAQLMMRNGLVVEGAAAAGIASLKHLQMSRKAKVCCVITGSGLKFPESLKQILKKP